MTIQVVDDAIITSVFTICCFFIPEEIENYVNFKGIGNFLG